MNSATVLYGLLCAIVVESSVRFRRSDGGGSNLDELSDDEIFALLEKSEDDYEFPTEQTIELFNFENSVEDEFSTPDPSLDLTTSRILGSTSYGDSRSKSEIIHSLFTTTPPTPITYRTHQTTLQPNILNSTESSFINTTSEVNTKSAHSKHDFPSTVRNQNKNPTDLQTQNVTVIPDRTTASAETTTYEVTTEFHAAIVTTATTTKSHTAQIGTTEKPVELSTEKSLSSVKKLPTIEIKTSTVLTVSNTASVNTTTTTTAHPSKTSVVSIKTTSQPDRKTSLKPSTPHFTTTEVPKAASPKTLKPEQTIVLTTIPPKIQTTALPVQTATFVVTTTTPQPTTAVSVTPVLTNKEIFTQTITPTIQLDVTQLPFKSSTSTSRKTATPIITISSSEITKPPVKTTVAPVKTSLPATLGTTLRTPKTDKITSLSTKPIKDKTTKPPLKTKTTTKSKSKIRVKSTPSPKKATSKVLSKTLITSTKRPETISQYRHFSTVRYPTVSGLKEEGKIVVNTKPIKQDNPPYKVSTENTDEALCFNLINPDGSPSNECFYPSRNEKPSKPLTGSGKVLDLTTKTNQETVNVTPVTLNRNGQLCFRLVNINGSESPNCFYLDAESSEPPPVIENMATLAPHRIFEITEKPLPLLKPYIAENSQATAKPPKVGFESATLAPNRIFEIPITGAKGKPRFQNANRKLPEAQVILHRPQNRQQVLHYGGDQFDRSRNQEYPIAKPIERRVSDDRSHPHHIPKTISNPSSLHFSIPVHITSNVEQSKEIERGQAMHHPWNSFKPIQDVRNLPGVAGRPLVFTVPRGSILIPAQRPHYSTDPKVTNVRIRIPSQGQFSQHASATNLNFRQPQIQHSSLDVTNRKGHFSEHQQTMRYRRSMEGQSPDPAEGVSLAFVVDTTFSMDSELNAVKKYALNIMDNMLNNENSYIKNLVFVPFHDEAPDNKLKSVVTNNRATLSEIINNIKVYGGRDCPEKMMAGLLKALNLAEKESYIFVFTDAYASDYYLTDRVIALIRKRRPIVNIILTGLCHEVKNIQQQMAYSYITSNSTGIVARVDKDPNALQRVIDGVARQIDKRRIIFTDVSHGPTGQKTSTFPVNVDPQAKEIQVTTTGENTSVNLIGPKGVPPTNVEQVLNMSNINIVSVPDPDPGAWTITVSSPTSPFKLVVSGISTTDFIYGFSMVPTNDTSKLSNNPKKGARNYLILAAKDPSVVHNVTQVRLVSENNVIRTIPIKMIDSERGIFCGVPTQFPDEPFKMRIEGFTVEGFPITRLTKATLLPQMPGPPEIECKKKMIATAGLIFKLTCTIESLVPMIVKFYHKGNERGSPTYYGQTSKVETTFNVLSKNDEGIHTIIAKNLAGESSENVHLHVKEEPPTASLQQRMRTNPDQKIILKCEVTSFTPYTVSWNKYSAYSRYPDQLTSNNDNIIVKDDYLTIDPIRLEDEGDYVCNVQNGGGHANATTHLSVVEPTQVEIEENTVDGVKPFEKGSSVQVTCRVTKGGPSVDLYWHDNLGNVMKNDEDRRRQVYKGKDGYLTFSIYKATSGDEGVYTCIGKNSDGLNSQDVQEVTLRYTEMPTIAARKHRVEVMNGNRLTLRCDGTGIPIPQVTWLKKSPLGKLISVTSPSRELPDQYLALNSVSSNDSGTYICRATNIAGYADAEIKVMVGYKPRIDDLPKKLNATIFEPIDIFCNASGSPPPVISWRRADNLPINGYDFNGILTIGSVQLEDSGDYICLAESTFGSTKSSMHLTVNGAVPPQILKTNRVEVVESLASKTINLTCSVVESVPPPIITWTLDGRPIDIYSEMIVSKEDGTLTISSVHEEIAGNYTCEAKNALGTDTKTITLKLYALPKINHLSPEVEVSEGSNFSVACSATGYPEPEITWQKPDRSVISRTKDLIIEAVKITDGGKYLCIAENIAGRIRKDFTLNVLVPPKIKTWEAKMSVKTGSIVTLHCDLSGDSRAEIMWLKDNNTINNIGLVHRFIATKNDAGLYSCIATNSVGQARMDTNITVLEPPTILDVARVTEVIEGQSVVLKCTAVGNPVPALSWVFNEEILVRQEVSNGSAVLSIQHVTGADAGNYFCFANSSMGVDQRVTELHVLRPPMIVCRKGLYRLVPGEIADISCDVKAYPLPTILWYRNGDEFGFTSTDGKLQFVAKPEHSGPFTVQAKNKVGQTSATINIVVSEAPSFSPLLPSMIAAIVGSNASLPCSADGDPKPEISWDLDDFPGVPNKLVFNSLTGALDIYNVDLDDEGVYVCKAKNDAGLQTRSIYLDVSSVPEATIATWDLQNGTIQERRQLMLDCQTKGKPEPTVVWTKDGFPLNPMNYTLNFNKLRFLTTASSSGIYSCTARNSIGQKTASIAINVTAAPSIENPTDQDITELKGNEVVLNCIVHGNPIPNVTWLKNNLELKIFPEFIVTQNKLVIAKLSSEMEGTFSCIANNPLGSAEKLFKVNVNSLPIITTTVPEVIQVNQFDSYAIPCQAEGKPFPTIAWRIGDNTILTTDVYLGYSEKYTVKNDGTLLLFNITIEDAGTLLQCVATNKEGETSKNHTMHVIVPSSVGPHLQKVLLENPFVDVQGAADGDTHNLFCPALKGQAIEWYKDGEPVSLSSRRSDDPHYYLKNGGQTLTINGVGEEDTGRYTCKYIPSGDQQDFFINFLSKPSFYHDLSFWPDLIEVLDGKSVTVNCSARGKPEARVAWQVKDDVYGWIPFNNYTLKGTYFSGDQNDAFHIPEARLEHNGTYRCMAQNQLGKAIYEFSIGWSGPPQLQGDLTVQVKIPVGKPAEIKCEIHGTPEASFAWEFTYNGKMQRLPVKESELYIKEASVENTGQYKCVGTNTYGYAVQIFLIKVIEPPKILNPGVTSLIYKTHDDVELRFIAQGEDCEIHWMKEDFTVVKSKRVSFNSQDNSGIITIHLKIIDASKEDSGIYKCLISNSAGKSEKIFEINVIVPPQPLFDYAVFDVKLGDTLNLQCFVYTESSCLITWKKDGMPLSERIIRGGKVYVASARKEDQGNYTCIATNEVASASSSNFIKIIVPPFIWNERNSLIQTVDYGKDFSFNCSARGDSPLIFTWMKNGELFDNKLSTWTSSRQTRLIIEKVTEADAGNYSCIAYNSAGSAQSVVQVVVRGKQVRSIPFGTVVNYTVQLDHFLKLDCPLKIFSPLIHWFKVADVKNKLQLANALNHSTLSIHDVDFTDGGVYSCEIDGNYPATKYFFRVIVLIPLQWSDWSQWSQCSQSCDVGEQTQHRYCTEPLKIHAAVVDDGFIRLINESCLGHSVNHRFCNPELCPISGGFSEWSEWGECSVTCGMGSKSRYRSCTNPRPAYGGLPCSSEAVEEKTSCFKGLCSLDGKWGEWSEWSQCSTTCGQSHRTRIRKCNDPPPLNEGRDCQGGSKEISACHAPACTVIREEMWSNWSPFGPCSQTCGPGGVKKRTRTCLEPIPCSGSNFNIVLCTKNEFVPKCRHQWGAVRHKARGNGHFNNATRKDKKMSAVNQSKEEMNPTYYNEMNVVAEHPQKRRRKKLYSLQHLANN